VAAVGFVSLTGSLPQLATKIGEIIKARRLSQPRTTPALRATPCMFEVW